MSLAGKLSGDVSIEGDAKAPTVGGIISLIGAKVRETFLGDGTLKLTPGADAIAIRGSLFGNVSIDGYLTLFPKFTVAATVRFNDLELDRLLPEMKKFAEVRGRTTGEARVTFDGASGLTFVGITLDKLSLALSGVAGRRSRWRNLVVKNQDPVKLSTDLNVLRVDRAHLISQLGEFQVLGQVSAKNSDVHLHGQIGLELLEYFFHSAFEHTHGDAFVDLVVKGDLERPELKGWIDLRNALVQPLGLEHRLAVPVGRIDFTAERITLSNLSLMMDGAVAHASGWMALQKWVPGQVFGDVRGNLSPRLLQWFLKDHLAEAAGSIALDVHFAGTFSQPEWSGVADIRNVNARLRRWEHDLEIKSGNLHFSQSDILLGCPRTRSRAGLPHAVGQHRRSPDSSSIDGSIGFRGGTLKAVDVMLNGSELPHRGEA